MASARTQARARRRQRRREAEQEILDAAEQLLRERPVRELTVDDVMARTTQSRTAFYRYFADRQELLVRLLQGAGEELYAMAELWLAGAGSDPWASGRAALERLVSAYEAHGPLLRALAEAAPYEEELERAYRALAERFIAATAARIERDLATGLARRPLDARSTAAALVWMNERYLATTFGRPGGDRDAAVRTLFTIWMRTLYGDEVPPSRPS